MLGASDEVGLDYAEEIHHHSRELEIPWEINDWALSLSASLKYRYLVKHCEDQSPLD